MGASEETGKTKKAPATMAAQEMSKSNALQETPKEVAAAAGWGFWVVLGLIVAMLLAMIAKLLPKPDG